MLNSDNKLMLALMLSSSFIAQELKSNQEEELEEEVAGEEDSDEEKGLSKVAMIATGCATVAAVGIIVAACNKDKIKDFYDRTCTCPFTEVVKLEKQYHDENDSAKKAALKVKIQAERDSVFHDAYEKAELNLVQSIVKSTHPDFRTMLAQLAIEKTSAGKAFKSAEKSFDEAVRAAEVPAAAEAAEAAAAAAAPSFPNLVSRVPVLKAELALELVQHRICLVSELIEQPIVEQYFIRHGKYVSYYAQVEAARQEEARQAEATAREALAEASCRA
jgi:hypothetical protein